MTNMSESTSHDPIGRSRTEISVEVTMATLVCLSAMFGNLLVVFVIKRDSKLHNVTNMFIHSLALTDIAMATMYMPFWIASLYTGTWNFSQVCCQVAGSILLILAYASMLTVGLIALNRYIQVVKPNFYKKLFPSKRAARLYCVLVWLVAILLAITFLGGWVGITYFTRTSICSVESSVYILLIVGVVITGIMIAIFYCYFKIYKAVRESKDILKAHADGNRVRPSNDSRRSDITDVKVLKACFTVACFYVVTWTPISIIAITWNAGFDLGQQLSTASTFLMFSSSFVNPFIYGIMNPQFKLAFKMALKCGCYGRGNKNQSQTGNSVRHVVVTGLETAL